MKDLRTPFTALVGRNHHTVTGCSSIYLSWETSSVFLCGDRGFIFPGEPGDSGVLPC